MKIRDFLRDKITVSKGKVNYQKQDYYDVLEVAEKIKEKELPFIDLYEIAYQVYNIINSYHVIQSISKAKRLGLHDFE